MKIKVKLICDTALIKQIVKGDWFNLTNRVYKANLKKRIKYLFTKDI